MKTYTYHDDNNHNDHNQKIKQMKTYIFRLQFMAGEAKIGEFVFLVKMVFMVLGGVHGVHGDGVDGRRWCSLS